MAIKISKAKDPYFRFEIRWVRPQHRGSFPIIGFYGIRKGFEVNTGGFYVVFGKSYKLEPTPMTKEDHEAYARLTKEEDNA